MRTQTFQNLTLSALGMGAMRLPKTADGAIDEPATFAMVDEAMAHGINYYDTAWGYHDGNSEPVMGRALGRYPRESYFLASKFPGYDLNNMDKVRSIFEKQLERCNTPYFDFYLFHNVCERNIDAYLDPKYGIYDYLMEQKRNGRIRHLGFSIHGSMEVMDRFLAAYGKDMEFCQIQLNWLDYSFQNARGKVRRLGEWNIPVWVMEPVRGGKLSAIEPEHMKKLNALRPGVSAVEWAFRWLENVPGVTMILSGMSNMEQLRDNLRIFEASAPLSTTEQKTMEEIARQMTGIAFLPCTACRYCTTHCPQGLDIPWLLELYNEHMFTADGFAVPAALKNADADKWPSACIGCRSCEAVCPQQIRIADAMTAFAQKLG